MVDTLAITALSHTPSEVLVPSCFDQLTALDVDFGHATTFDDGRGVLLLTQGSGCWDEIREGFTSMSEWLLE